MDENGCCASSGCLVLLVVLALGIHSCDDGILSKLPDPIYHSKRLFGKNAPPRVIFEGKVTNDATGQWPNERLVVAYLGETEVGRAVTTIGKSKLSGEGVHDGYFQIETPNIYRIGSDDLSLPSGVPLRDRNGTVGVYVTVEEGSLEAFNVPSKNKTYALRVFSGPVDELPESIQQPKTTKFEDGTVIASLENAESITIDELLKMAEPDRPAMVESAEQLVEAVAAGVASIAVRPARSERPSRIIKSYPNNCGNRSPARMRLHESREFIKELVADAGAAITVVPGPMSPVLGVGAEGRLGSINTTSMEISVEIPANSRAEYGIEIREIVDQFFLHFNGSSMKLPFSLRKGLAFEPKLIGITKCH